LEVRLFLSPSCSLFLGRFATNRKTELDGLGSLLEKSTSRALSSMMASAVQFRWTAAPLTYWIVLCSEEMTAGTGCGDGSAGL
jgi:hypothetical protein